MDILLQELANGLHDKEQFARIAIRLIAAAILGAAIGAEREFAGKAAGLRTHIVVALGTCTFIAVCAATGFGPDALSRVIQGIITGLGFIGAGAILKGSGQTDIKGLTTAAGIWATAAIGVGCGLGVLGISLMATILILIIQIALRRVEHMRDIKIAKKDTEK